MDIAVIIGGKITQIIKDIEAGRKLTFDRLAIIDGRPDLKVGDPWPPCTVAELQKKEGG